MVFTELLISNRFVIQVVDLKAWSRDRTQNVNRLFLHAHAYTRTLNFIAKIFVSNSRHFSVEISSKSSSAKERAPSILKLLQINC